MYTFSSWKLTAYGYHDNDDSSNKDTKAVKPDKETVKDIMKKEFKDSRSATIKRAQPSSKRGPSQNKTFKDKLQNAFETKNSNLNNFDSRDYIMANKNIENNEEEVDELYSEINHFLRQLEIKDPETKSYLEDYLEYKRKQEEKKRMRELIVEITDLLEEKLENSKH